MPVVSDEYCDRAIRKVTWLSQFLLVSGQFKGSLVGGIQCGLYYPV